MTDFATGAVRDTGGKGRCDLLPHSSLLRVSHHMENALEHHEERNWEKGIPMHCFMDSAMRHIFKYMDGRTDEDHLAAAASNLLMALWTEDHLPGMQDIPSRESAPAGPTTDREDGDGHPEWHDYRRCAGCSSSAMLPVSDEPGGVKLFCDLVGVMCDRVSKCERRGRGVPQ